MSASKAKETVILGIDPGTTVMGYGLIKVVSGEIRMITAGCIKLSKYPEHADRLKVIFDRLVAIIDEYHPDEMGIEAPFFGKNVQSMLKLGRAQGVAIAACLSRDIPYVEYAPRRIKQSITGNGAASKEQVASMLASILKGQTLPKEHDATDGLAAAVCHQYSKTAIGVSGSGAKGWSAFLKDNADRIIKK